MTPGTKVEVNRGNEWISGTVRYDEFENGVIYYHVILDRADHCGIKNVWCKSFNIRKGK